MSRILSGTRFLVVVPVIGLALAAGAFFVFGGFGLIRLLVLTILEGGTEGEIPFAVEVLEYVHTFLIGTVLYITAIGLYQLFVEEIDFPGGWLKIDSTEELETNLIGVTIVVLAVNFMGFTFTNDPALLLEYGAGIALPIAALALFIGLRAWSTKLNRTSNELENEGRGE